MSDTNRYSPRRHPVSAPRDAMVATSGDSSPARIEALRKLVAAGQYHVSPRWLATKIFRAAGLKVPE